MRKILGTVLTLALVGMLTLALSIQQSESSPSSVVVSSDFPPTIYIRANGAVEGTSYIQTVDNVTYFFTADINGSAEINGSIVVQRNNITLDGKGHALYPPFLTDASRGLLLVGVENITIRNMTIRSFDYGICLSSSDGNTISENSITASIDYGIYLVDSSHNTISGNNVTANYRYGIWISGASNHNNLFGNILTANYNAIWLQRSPSYNNISGNFISSNEGGGVDLWWSNYNNVFGNIIRNNTFGIDSIYSNDSKIFRNDISVNVEGVELSYSSNNNVYGNNITANKGVGISIIYAYRNIIRRNEIIANDYAGIDLDGSNNTISENEIRSNKDGMLILAPDNSFFHNNFVNNLIEVPFSSTPNAWDDGYPSGGNFWSNYTGQDANGDAIGDTSYYIDSSNQDRYPLMHPWSPTPTVLIATHATLDVGQSHSFNSTVWSGIWPYTYQWYSNGTAILGATDSAWIFVPNSSGTYNIHVNVTDDGSVEAKSNIATVKVNPVPSITVSPVSVALEVGQSQTFTCTISGGTSPYSYQWYLNGTAVPGATGSSWTFTVPSSASYTVYVNVTDGVDVIAVSSVSHANAYLSGPDTQFPVTVIFVVSVVAIIAVMVAVYLGKVRRRKK